MPLRADYGTPSKIKALIQNTMKFFRPKSVLSLVLIGFSIVALPLVFSLIYAMISVDRLVDQSQQAVFQAVQATKGSLTLMEEIRTMERSVRQFQILEDKTLFQMYEKSHNDLLITVNLLSQLPMEEHQGRLLKQLTEKEQDLFDTLKNSPPQSEIGKAAVSKFSSLSSLSQSILAENSRLVSREIDLMKQKGEKTQEMLVWQIMGITPIVVIFVIIFTTLIARPIRQIDHAIRKLGDGTFSSKISISGPKDLEYLGRRLDWLRTRLQDLEEQKSQFLRHVSHELKTPLTASRAGADLLHDEVVGKLNHEQHKIVQILQQSILNLQKMIENLLNFSVVLERHSSFTLKPVKLSHLIEKVLADHHLALMAKKIHIDLDLLDMIGQAISGDEDKLIVVIDNLISNSVKFSQVNSKIKISLTKKGDEAVLDVIDSGPGVAPEDKGRVFDPFYQGQRQPENNVEGTGIGLSLAKEYALAHHGMIELVEDESRGAHFRVKLPMNQFKDDQ